MSKLEPLLVFTGTKNFGRQLEERLKRDLPNTSVKFISAEDNKADKQKWIEAFKDNDLDILISTTILAWGVNLPARRTIISHTSFGLEKMPVADVQQMIGRTGRPAYHDEGDAYILLDNSDYDHWVNLIESGEDIKSLFGDSDVLQFHAMAEICNENIKTVDDFPPWYGRSFAHVQKITPADSESVVQSLKDYGAVKVEDEIIPTNLGKIGFWFYYSPRVIWQWYKNLRLFSSYFDSNEKVEFQNREVTVGDVAVSMAYNWYVETGSYLAKNEQNAMREFKDFVRLSLPEFTDYSSDITPTYKDALAMLLKLNGIKGDAMLTMIQNKMAADFGRITTAINLISSMGLHNDISDFFDALKLRFSYGVKSDLISLVSIKGIGATYAKRLHESGISSRKDLLNKDNYQNILDIMGKKRADVAIKNALF